MSDIGPDQIPVPGGGTGVNQPESPYGAVADLNKLKAQFPQGAQGAGPLPTGPPGPLGPVGASPSGAGGFNPGGDGGGGPLPGLPAGILDPTNEPGTPVDSPLAEPLGAPGGTPLGGAMTPAQNRLRIIEALRQSDDPDTREFAEMMIRLLTQG